MLNIEQSIPPREISGKIIPHLSSVVPGGGRGYRRWSRHGGTLSGGPEGTVVFKGTVLVNRRAELLDVLTSKVVKRLKSMVQDRYIIERGWVGNREEVRG